MKYTMNPARVAIILFFASIKLGVGLRLEKGRKKIVFGSEGIMKA
jgi:hypothetical protein